MRKILHIYDKIEENVLIIMLAVSVLVVFFQVVMRYVFNSSLVWSEELARYLYIWMGWLGISIVERNKTHIAVDVLVSKLNGTPQIILKVFISIVCIGTCLYLSYYGFSMAAFNFKRKVTSAGLGIPTGIVFIGAPLSMLMYSIRVFIHMLEDLKLIKPDESEETREVSLN